MAFVMILIDGMGIAPDGVADPVRGSSSLLRDLHPHHPVPLPMGGWAVPTRADMGVSGLPQSATGQTALLTGINAARRLGRHMPGFPSPTLRGLIEAHNVLKMVLDLGLRAAYVNAFRPISPIVKKRNLLGALTLAAQASGQRLLGVREILEGRALHHEFTNQLLIQHGERLPVFSPHEAGQILGKIARAWDFTVFEYFLTDLAGHAQNPEEAAFHIRKVDAFLWGLLESMDLQSTHVMVCSDHGNVENLSVRTHTNNPVPTLVWGPDPLGTASKIQAIEQIPVEVLRLLAAEPRGGANGT